VDAMKVYSGVEMCLQSSLTPAPDGLGRLHTPTSLAPSKESLVFIGQEAGGGPRPVRTL